MAIGQPLGSQAFCGKCAVLKGIGTNCCFRGAQVIAALYERALEN